MTDPKLEITKLSHFRKQVENANNHTERGLSELSKAYNEVGYVAVILERFQTTFNITPELVT